MSNVFTCLLAVGSVYLVGKLFVLAVTGAEFGVPERAGLALAMIILLIPTVDDALHAITRLVDEWRRR